MRMKSCGVGLLAALILASGGGCKKSASEADHPQSQSNNLSLLWIKRRLLINRRTVTNHLIVFIKLTSKFAQNPKCKINM